MPKLRRPSPALVIACVALAISLSGVGYAAVTLADNSVGSRHVKPDALRGVDILESSLEGLVRGTGVARAASKELDGSAGYQTVLVIPGVGRLEGDCEFGGGLTLYQRFVNTTGVDAAVWVGADGDPTAYQALAAGEASAAHAAGNNELARWMVRTGTSGPLTVIHVASTVIGVCVQHAVAQRTAKR
jgi:hypothetical protein